MRSKVFESRKISHPAAVTADVFCHKYKQTKFKSLAWQRNCARHKMSAQWTKIWAPRYWKPLTEEGNHKSQAAWAWLQQRMGGGAVTTSLGSARFSKLVVPYVLVKRSSDAAVYASMGNASWAALGWPMNEAGADEDGLKCYAWQPEAGMVWFHVTDPSDWHVIPSLGVRGARGILSKQTAEPVPLLRYCLLHHSSTIAYQELVSCVSHLSLAVAEGSTRVQLLAALNTHFGDVFVDEQKRPDAAEALVSDPLAEAVFGDMDATEQTEFPDVCHALMQKRQRERVAEWRMMRGLEVPRRGRKPRPKAGRLVRRGLRCLEQNGDVSVGQLGRSLWAMVAQMQMRLLRTTSHLWQMDLRSQRLLLLRSLSQSLWNPNCPRQLPLALRFLRFRRPGRQWWQLAEDDGRPGGAAAAPRPAGLARRVHVGETWETVLQTAGR